MLHRSESGFTLIEILIVVVVLGVLAAIAIPRYSSAKDKAYQAAVIRDLKTLAHLEEVYFTNNQTYSGSLSDLGLDQSAGVTITVNEATTSGWAAIGSHAGLPGEQCGIYYGAGSAAKAAPAKRAGTILCGS